MTKEALKLALEALEANHFLIHGSETKGGLAFCMDGYYSGCFDIDSNDKQTNEAFTAIKEALAQPEHDYKDLYEKEKRRSAMWLSKYEEVAGPAPKAIPMAQPEQEPVAWLCRRKTGGSLFVYTEEQLHELGYGNISVPPFDKVAPLYTTPPQTEKKLITVVDIEKIVKFKERNT
jgi:hypothetical protein